MQGADRALSAIARALGDDAVLRDPDVRASYATDESASLAKTGSANFLGSRVSDSRSLRMARPMRMRLTTRPLVLTEDHSRSTGHHREGRAARV